MKYFCGTTNFWPTYIRAYGDLLNPCLVAGKKVFQGGPSQKRGLQSFKVEGCDLEWNFGAMDFEAPAGKKIFVQ